MKFTKIAVISKIYVTLIQYFMCIYKVYICIYMQDLKFL